MSDEIRIKKITPLAQMKLLVLFTNGIIKIYDAENLPDEFDFMKPLKNPDVFRQAYVAPGGSGIIWNEDMDISEWELWEKGIQIPVSQDDLLCFISNNTVSTSEACEILDCTRQNIDALTKNGKITPVQKLGNNKLFARSEIMARKAAQDNEKYWDSHSFSLHS